tara:strand:+ start:4941 stop:5570 length:630 start_codon:yes stop_codon:yes gene_type:complete
MNTVTYTLDPKSLVVKGYASDKAARSMGNGVAFFTNAEELLADRNVTARLLVDAYNEVSDKPVKKFSDNKTAAKRYMAAIADIHVRAVPTPQIAPLSGMAPLGIKPSPNYPQAPVEHPDVATLGLYEPKAVKPRVSFAGKIIKCLVSENPRREGTRGFKNFNVFLGSNATLKYEEFVKLAEMHGSTKGGCREDLAHDIKKGRVELIDVC